MSTLYAEYQQYMRANYGRGPWVPDMGPEAHEGQGGSVIAELMQDVHSRDDGHLDRYTLSLIRQVLSRAAKGWTDAELLGYLAYRKRVADKGDKVKVQRVMTALRTDRWGVREAVEAMREEFERHRRRQVQTRDARWAWRDQIAQTNAMIPENRRGRQPRVRKRKRQGPRRPYPRPATLA